MKPAEFQTLDEQLRTCIHCGLCLNACPTYRLGGDELESPRGRLVVMREVLEGTGDFDPAQLRAPLDSCLGCLGCQTACPSGVPYGELLTQARQRLGPAPGVRSRAVAWLVDEVLTRPHWLAPLAWAGQSTRRWNLDRLLPTALRSWLDALPARPARWPGRVTTASPAGKVALLRGCAQWVFEPEVLAASARLVRAAGGEVVVPPDQGCCGALSHHQASTARARELAARNLDAFEGCEALLSASAGCSAFLREMPELFAYDPPRRDRARVLSERSQDLLPWLAARADRLHFRPTELRVVYHGPCHHQHAQGIVDEGPSLLQRIPGLRLVRAAGEQLCCGSAGSYSLHQPETARAQRAERLDQLLATGADRILTANPGCEFFLESGLLERGSTVRIEPVATFLAERLEEGPH